MLIIRLQRVGRVHEPVFRLVLTDSKNSTKSGRFLEILGSYDARNAEAAIFDNEKILHFISKGAQTSETVHNLLLKRGVIKGEKRNVLSRRPAAKAAPEPAPEPVAEVAPTAPEEAPIEAPTEEAPEPDLSAQPQEPVVETTEEKVI